MAYPTAIGRRPDGRFVQAIGIDASEWARSLPEIIRAIEASGQFSDAENLRKLRAGLNAPLPIDAVGKIAHSAHRRAIN